MNAQYLPIEAFCGVGSGSTPSRAQSARYYNGDIPWVKSGELREGIIEQTEERITPAALKETAVKLVPKGAILVAMYGATIGRVGILGIEATTNQAVCHVVPDPEKASTRYLFHALRGCFDDFVAKGVGGAQPNISQQIIRQTPIFLPELSEQRRIAAILDQADALRAKRRAALAQLDEMARAMFVEMFGLPKSNPYGWPLKRIAEVCSPKQWPTITSEDLLPSGYPVFGANGVIGYFSEYNHAEPTVLVTCRGATCGTINICEPKSYVTGNAMALDDPAKDLVAVPYLATVLKIRGLEDAISGSAQPQITRQSLAPVHIPIPPLSLQRAYAAKMTVIAAVRRSHEGAAETTDNLFAALQNRAFRGEL